MNSLGVCSGIQTGTWGAAGISIPGCGQNLNEEFPETDVCLYLTSCCFFGQSDQHIRNFQDAATMWWLDYTVTAGSSA